MKHTYFYDTLQWTAEGTYYDEEEKSFPLHGEVSILHSETEWSLTGFLEVRFTGEPGSFYKRLCYQRYRQAEHFVVGVFQSGVGNSEGNL